MPQRKQPMALEDMARSRIAFWLSSRKDPETTVVSRSMEDRAMVPYALERKLVKSLIENFLCVKTRATWNDACGGRLKEMIAYLLRLDALELDFEFARLIGRLKNLTVLSYEYGFRAVAEFLKLQETVVEAGSYEDDGANVIPPTLNLTYLMEKANYCYDRDSFRNNVNMAKIARACPRLTHFRILYMEEKENIIFSDIELFKKLSSISINAITRGGGGSCFQAYISSFGDSLRELNLSCKDFPVDAVLSLGTYCQNLEKLRIIRQLPSGCEVRGYPKISTGFRSLRFLMLGIRFSGGEIPEGEVSYLLRSAVKLEELHLSGGLSFMTDAYWNEFLRSVNPLVRLRVLNFDSYLIQQSIRLGISTARLFIDSCPLLSEMYLGSWTNISACEIKRLKDEVAANNYELLVTSWHNEEIFREKLYES
ncbi:unnamed protein product [Notodromas monacha]|uniref:Uncharacterized protein n=1 Tax=Notodromas monacha TaxID=399045 RepID=A0A7R9BWS9_9CRUS|nr:unnamed protein product [Notodromas monacha]CAG0921562.1 unnamed protein product [Notodromas monacha]